MAIKIPNTLEPANNDFPVVSSDHIDVDELDERKNLTQYLKDVYAELTETLETNHSNDDQDRQTKYEALDALIDGYHAEDNNDRKLKYDALDALIDGYHAEDNNDRKLKYDALDALIDGYHTEDNNDRKLKYDALDALIDGYHTEDNADRKAKYESIISHLNTLLGNSDDGDKSIEDQLTDLRKLLLLSLFGSETYSPSNMDNPDGSGRNITNKIRDLRTSIRGWLYNNEDSIGNRINTKSSEIINKIETERQNLDQKFSGLLGNDDTSIADILERIENRIKNLDIELTGVEGSGHSEDNSSYIYAITNAVRDVIQQQITNLDTELTGDGTNVGKITAAKEALDETLDEVKNLIEQLDNQLTGSDNIDGQLAIIANSIKNDIKYTIKNTTDRVKISVSNITATTADVVLEYDIDDAIERISTNISVENGKIGLNKTEPTIFTVSIQNTKDTPVTVYSKSIEVMRKAPIYVGHSDIYDLGTFDTGVFDKNYLTDSLYGECEIPANSWVVENENTDAYLYIAIPTEFFGQKTVQTADGTETVNLPVNLQLLQNGFPVGSKYADTDDYFIYRSSQMISEHSTLELK